MAALGVVSFHNGNSPQGKIHILQESANNIANNTNNIIKNDKREIVVLKKKPKIFPANQQTVSVTSLINSQNSVLVQNKAANIPKPKKTMKSKDSVAAKVHNPPPIAVARRNARERNRVKQVNNGFATLRQHIPNEIAEIYENANNNRAANKKLSKVETLRMAVEYIRSLEILLDIEDNRDYKENNANISMSSFPSPASSESPQNGSSFEQSYFMQSPLLEDEEESNPPTPLPPVTNHHYSRIPGTNAFQLIPGPAPLHHYEDDENIHPLTPSSDLISQDDMLMHPHLMDTNMDFIQNNGQEFAIIQPSLLSPDFYSDSSLSPHGNVDSLDMKYVTTLMSSDQQLLYPHSILISNSPDGSIHLHSENSRDRLQNSGVIIKDEQNKNVPILMRNNENLVYSDDFDLKQEPEESDGGFSHERNGDMEEVLSWWNGQQRQDKRL